MPRIITIALIAALLSACSFGNGEKTITAPGFKLLDLNGKSVQLSDFKGKPVLIDFWATWCPPCRDAVPSLVKLHKTYSAKGLVVLGISMDQGGWDDVLKFTKAHGMLYPVLKGTDSVQDDYQVRTIPMIVLINKEGTVVKRYIGIGYDEELEKAVQALL